ncbi:uncharacterized protein EI90DRAFT_3290198 [Cantharellus anzutake]|uniref:uncharacterized protein n=1 Tax=Cantharellus anzutake TaxID=1750568 RepID=UPI00190659DE|nr:uncharacterized protein EI90DRAFT_3290198 [Cantharellus anzutake]KAF8329499.1 hypothetical protein EI90DRAFT_3290198 [Cantharellus anzutake]
MARWMPIEISSKIQDLTELLRDLACSVFPDDTPDVEQKRVLFCQINWFSFTDDFHRQDTKGLHFFGFHQFSEEWILKLAWSDWSYSEEGRGTWLNTLSSEGTLAILTSRHIPLCVAFVCSMENGIVSMNIDSGSWTYVMDNDTRTVTSLKWTRIIGSAQMLVYTRPGTVHFARHSDGGLIAVSMPLSLVASIPGASNASPVSGLHYYEHHDMLLIILQDGSFQTIRNVSENPTVSGLYDGEIETFSLTRIAREVFVEAERGGEEKPHRKEVMQLFGVAPLGSFGSVVWVHEAKRPDLYAYTPDALLRSMIVCQQLWCDENLGELVIAEISRCLDHPPTPLVSSIVAPLLALLSPGVSLVNPLDEQRDISHSPDDLVDVTRSRFLDATRKSLYDSAAVLRNRLKFFISRYCSVRSIFHTNLSQANDAPFPDKDGAFLKRVTLVGLRSGDAACVQLAQRATEKFGLAVDNESVALFEFDLRETCRVCQAGVKFTDYSSAVCATGHVWERCSVTLELLEMPQTCVGCLQKVISPSPDTDGVIGLSWIAGDVVKAALGCLFCGSSFAKLL